MSDLQKVSDQFSAAGQVSPNTLSQAAQAGFQLVLNLRSPDESGVLPDEPQEVAASELHYTNVPLTNTNPSAVEVEKVLEAIESLPKPVLVQCGAGLRAGAIALLAAAIEEGLTPAEIEAKAAELGLSEQPHLQQYLEQFVQKNRSV
ncbi:MAG: phosphatase [Leptolyngbyaceae cyanobacterium SM1_3_5]|nr:phosphatase [Leptolyngbyaceae cyanobacterium SM1_3_5]